ncbi:transcription termination factor MTERF4, chloroplastic-like [Impatiens glandulifera]|uniref:transcription termination factor MTERF4, chloroplastic-like n=1 Tax=Impatiens glandulifera TaxID=253017 RepID=UPI001FB186F4|nr:transcription termination factor MTERF4, chloroplastic-like [Impatiens glandulifera]
MAAMFHLVSKRLHHFLKPISASTTNHVYLFSSSCVNSTHLSDEHPPLMNLFKSHGLTHTHIKNLITDHPGILQADLENTLKPNIELLSSLGISHLNLEKVISLRPRILFVDILQVVELFRAYCFSDNQISTIIMKYPVLLTYKPGKYLKPKLDYLISIGLSSEDISRLVLAEPTILTRSLENQLMPSVEVIRRVVGSESRVLKAIKSCHRLLGYNLEKVLEGNITILTNHGVPRSIVDKLFYIHMNTLLNSNGRLTKVVVRVSDLGISPKTNTFILATRVLSSISDSVWERKKDVYSSFGLSEENLITLFKVLPSCMLISEKKINKMMNFLLNEMKCTFPCILKQPLVLLHSFEKRILPRWSVLRVLISKDVIKKDISLLYAMRISEKRFFEKFVVKYEKVRGEKVALQS